MTQPADFFTPSLSKAYDERNSKLAPISDNLHFLMRLVLAKAPAQAKVLCVGVGTGAEILSLAQAFPNWTFTGLDPSASMLEVCAERLQKAGFSNRCQLVHGYIQDVEEGANFDIALSILVAHFVKTEERGGFFKHMTNRLKTGGVLINAEISADLNAPEFPHMLEDWKQVQTLMGATPESLAGLENQLRNTLEILPPQTTETILRQSGIPTPIRFFQSILIQAWHGRKSS